MNTLLLSSLLACLFNFLLGLFVLIKNYKNRINILFSLFLFSTSLAIVGDFFYLTFLKDLAPPIFWLRFAYIGGTFCPSLLMHFTLIYTKIKIPKAIICFFYLLSSTALYLSMFSKDVFSNVHIKNNVLQMNTGTYSDLLYGYISLSLIIVLGLGIWRFFNSEGLMKKQMKNFIGGILLYIFAGLFYVPAMQGIFNIRIDNICITIFSFIIAYGITKQHFLDIKLNIKKVTSFIITLIFIAVSTSIVFGYLQGLNFLFRMIAITCFTVFWAFTAYPFQKFLITTARRAFTKGYYDADKLLVKITELAQKCGTFSEIFDIIDEQLYNELELGKSMLVLAKKQNNKLIGYKLKEFDYKLDPITKTVTKNVLQESELTLDNPLTSYFQKITVTTQFKETKIEIQKEILNLGFSKKTLVLPFHSPEILEGLVIIGERSNQVNFRDDDFNFLKMLIHNINALFYKLTPYEKIEQEFQKNKEKLYETQVQLVRAEKIAGLARSIQNTNHEIRTPLYAISLATENIADLPHPTSEELANYFNTVKKQVERGMQIAETSLEIASNKSKKLEKLDLNKVIEEALLLLPPSGYKIIKNLTDLPQIKGIRKDLIGLIINLLNNANKAMPNGGTVTISTIYNKNLKQIILEIADSGVGIAPENLERIWEPYFTTDATDGHGLGLSLVHQIVNDHKATIKVESILNKGTKFTIKFFCDKYGYK